MFKKLFLLFSFFLTFTIVQGQQCENLSLEDIPMICTDDTVTLTPNFLNGAYKSTRAYVINGPLPCPVAADVNAQPSNIVADDDWSFDIAMSFDFCFFENQYDHLVVSDNGKISFDLTLEEGQYDAWPVDETYILPTQQIQTNAIFAPFMDTLSTADSNPGETISFDLLNEDDPGNRIFVINFDIPQYSCNNLRLRSRVMLYETSNVIDIIIFEKPVCIGWNDGMSIVGIQNKSGTIGYSPFNRGTYDENNTPPTQFHTWTPGDADSPNFDPELGELFRFVPDGLDSSEYNFTWFKEDANGIFQYYSGDESITVTPEEAENYMVQLSFQSACNDELTTIDASALVTPLNDPIQIEFCENALGSGVADFNIEQTALIVNGLNSSQYNIFYTNDLGDPITVLSPYTSTGETISVTVEDPDDSSCASTFTFDLVVTPLLDSSFNYAFSNYCLNDVNPTPDSITNPGGLFTIDNGGFIDSATGEIDLTLTGLGTDSTGSFNVTYTTAEPCSTETITTITLESFFDLNFEFPSTVCIDDANPTPITFTLLDSAVFSVDNGATINIFTGELDLSTTVVGTTYSITYGISDNCTPSIIQEVEIVDEDDSSFSYTNNIVCIDNTNPTPTAVTSGGIYTIDSGVIDATSGEVNLTDSGTGDFIITYTTQGSCSTFSTYTLTIVDVRFGDDILTDLTECDTYSLPNLEIGNYFTATNGGGIALSAGDDITSSQTIYVFNESNTTPNCTDEYSFILTLIDSPIANSPTTELSSCNNGNGSANFNIDASEIENEIIGSQTGVTVTYHPTEEDAENGVNAMSTSPLLVATGNVWARVEAANNCFAITEVTLTVEQCFLIFPEVFSPNSATEENKKFNVDGLREKFPNFDMFVYNRYGNEVYYGNASKTENWNGKKDNSGDELPTGTYYFIVQLHDAQQITHKGWVYLQR